MIIMFNHKPCHIFHMYMYIYIHNWKRLESLCPGWFGSGSPENWTPVSARSMAQKSVDLNMIFVRKGVKIMEYSTDLWLPHCICDVFGSQQTCNNDLMLERIGSQLICWLSTKQLSWTTFLSWKYRKNPITTTWFKILEPTCNTSSIMLHFDWVISTPISAIVQWFDKKALGPLARKPIVVEESFRLRIMQNLSNW